MEIVRMLIVAGAWISFVVYTAELQKSWHFDGVKREIREEN